MLWKAVTASGLGISDHDLVTGELHWSLELRAILGVDEDAPASIDSYMKLLHPDDRCAALKFQQLSEAGLRNLGPAVETMAEAEALIGHKMAVRVRLENLSLSK